MYAVHAYTLPFEDNRLSSQVPSWVSTLTCTFDQFRSGPDPHHEDADGSVTPAERSWQGNATPPGTQPQTFTLIKVDLGSCYLFLPNNRLLHSLYV